MYTHTAAENFKYVCTTETDAEKKLQSPICMTFSDRSMSNYDLRYSEFRTERSYNENSKICAKKGAAR